MARTRGGKITKDKTKMAEEASSNAVLENQEYPIPLRIIAACDIGGNEEAENVINEVRVSPSKGKSSEPGNRVHENEIEEDVDIVGNSVNQPAGDSVKNLGKSIVGESSVNPPVTGTMNIQEEMSISPEETKRIKLKTR
ncbi:hypothetical protein LIER_12962 [Lithospermum erythrorhizon]|uniref:Uncharacterized protein n=1 Tax=Lithospermum erythrorhizon TaxID=34254 RepID=A0AAV3PY84_LITER